MVGKRVSGAPRSSSASGSGRHRKSVRQTAVPVFLSPEKPIS